MMVRESLQTQGIMCKNFWLTQCQSGAATNYGDRADCKIWRPTVNNNIYVLTHDVPSRHVFSWAMCFRGPSVFVGSFSGAFSRARGKISQLTHVYKHLPCVACCLIQVLSIKFISIFAASTSRGSVGKQVLYLMTISCRLSSRCCSGRSAQKI